MKNKSMLRRILVIVTLLALLIASPVALPALLQSTQMQAMFENFSSAASYHSKLSYLNWHLQKSVDIESFIEQAQELKSGKAAD